MKAAGFTHYLPVKTPTHFGTWSWTNRPPKNATAELRRSQGGIVSIDDTDLPMPMGGMKMKAASFHRAFMYARSIHQTPDMVGQHHLLAYVADKVDAGQIKTTLNKVLSPKNAANMPEALRLVETGQAKGKIVIEGF